MLKPFLCVLPWKATGRHIRTPYSSSWLPKQQFWLLYSLLPKMHTHTYTQTHNERRKGTKGKGAVKLVRSMKDMLPLKRFKDFSAFINMIVQDMCLCYVLLCASVIKGVSSNIFIPKCSLFCHIKLECFRVGQQPHRERHTHLTCIFVLLFQKPSFLFSLTYKLSQRDKN